MILAGVDAGATTTRAVAVADDGRVVGRASAGPGNPHNAGVKEAAAAIARAVREAAGGPIPDLVVAGVAGIEDPAIKEGLRAALVTMHAAGKIHLASDAEIALDGAFLGAPGIIVVAGTGSVSWGRDARGNEARAGGWGHILDDAGSGYDVGRAALGAVLREHDGRGGATALTHRVLSALHLAGPEQIVGAARGMTPAQMAGLAPLVMDAAELGDTMAAAIVREAGRHLAEMAAAVWRGLRFAGAHPVAGIGGLFGHAVLRSAFAGGLRRACPEAVPTPPRLQPAGGALWRAFAVKGIEPPPGLIDALRGE